MKVFIDTGGWLSVLHDQDQYHVLGARYFQGLMDSGASLVTTDFVLDETITRYRYDAGHRKAAAFLNLIQGAVDLEALSIRRVTDELWARAEAIFLRFTDVSLSFTDCTSFALLREQPVDEVFGYDAHFEMMGHVLQPKA